MVLQRPPFLGFLVLAAVASAAGATFSIRRRETQGAVPLAAVMGFAAWWIVAYGLQLASVSVDAKVFWWGAKYVGIVFVPAAFLVFALEYTGYERWVTRRSVAALSVVPAIELVVVWTNPLHHWFVGPAAVTAAHGYVALANPVEAGFWPFVAYHYLVLLVGTALVARLFRSAESLYRSQTAALLVGLVTPWAANGLFLVGVRPRGFDLTPVGFIVTGLALGWAVHRAALLDIVPVPRELAREELLDSISEATVVLDDHLNVVELNPAAAELAAEEVEAVVGRPVSRAFPELAAAVRASQDDPTGRHEVELRRQHGTRFLDVRVSPLRRGRGTVRGYLLVAHDVTDRTRHRQRLEVMNRVLRHDIRNDINLILAHAEALSAGDDSDGRRVERIKEIAYDVVSLSDRARTFERTLGGEVELERVDLVGVVESLLASVRREHPGVAIESELPAAAPVAADPLIESAVKNLVENAIEHNDREDRWVTVRVEPDGAGWVRLEVADNGPGIPDDEREVIELGRETQIQHSSGLGLWLINWIITESGGEIRFDDRDGGGTRVTIRLRHADALDLGRYGPRTDEW